MTKPNERALRVAKKLLVSEGIAPARLGNNATGRMWTLQWSELTWLALAVVKAGSSASKKPAIKDTQHD